jgi:hypothetical protein
MSTTTSTTYAAIGELAVAVERRRRHEAEMARTDSRPHHRESKRLLSEAEQALATAINDAIAAEEPQ